MLLDLYICIMYSKNLKIGEEAQIFIKARTRTVAQQRDSLKEGSCYMMKREWDGVRIYDGRTPMMAIMEGHEYLLMEKTDFVFRP